MNCSASKPLWSKASPTSAWTTSPTPSTSSSGDEYCDWYIEIAKAQLNAAKASGNEAAARATRRTLIRVLETVLRLLHPITPFITEELWQVVAPVAGRKTEGSDESLVTAAYPRPDLGRVCAESDAWVAKLKAIVGTTRNLRSEMNLSPAERMPLLTTGDAEFIRQAAPIIQALGKLSEVQVLDEAAFAAATQMAPVAVHGEARLALHVEIGRRSREGPPGQGDHPPARRDHQGPGQVGQRELRGPRAPPPWSSRKKQRVADFGATVERLQGQLSRLG